MRRWRAGRVRPAGIQSRWRSSSLSRRRMLGRRSLLSRSGMCGRLRGGCEGARGHYRASGSRLWGVVSIGGAAPPTPPSRTSALRAALAHPPALGFSSMWGLRPHAPGSAGWTQPRAVRPPRPLRERVGVRGSDARRTDKPRRGGDCRGRSGPLAPGSDDGEGEGIRNARRIEALEGARNSRCRSDPFFEALASLRAWVRGSDGDGGLAEGGGDADDGRGGGDDAGALHPDRAVHLGPEGVDVSLQFRPEREDVCLEFRPEGVSLGCLPSVPP